MKLLAFVDVHGSLAALKKIVKTAKKEKPDLLVCAGDISIFENGLEYLLHVLNKLEIQTLIIDGNHESVNGMRKAASLFKNINYIHDKTIEKDDYLIFGYGGGGFAEVDKNFENSVKKHKKDLINKKIILITHAPPYGTKVDRIMGQYCGCKSVTRFIRKFNPILVICGHLHENAGKKAKIKNTIVINPGPYGNIIKL